MAHRRKKEPRNYKVGNRVIRKRDKIITTMIKKIVDDDEDRLS